MNKTGNKLAPIYAMYAFLIFSAVPYNSVYGLESQKDSININEQTKVSSLSEAPLFTQVNFSQTAREIFVNPKYTGEIISVTSITGNKDGAKIDVKETNSGWKKVTVSPSKPVMKGFQVTGLKGSLRVSLSDVKVPAQVNKIQPLNDLVISFGELNATLLLPVNKISDPGNFGIDMLDYKRNEFISGDVIAISNNQMAVKFSDLPSTVINRNGTVRVSIRRPNNNFIGADIKAWGYNILVPEIETGKSIPIKAKIFGLPEDTELRFTFNPASGQRITPSSRTLSVEKINSGAPLATVVTSIPGSQPLRVVVEKVNKSMGQKPGIKS
ncbi:MAG TPA: hypothetical protein VLB01_02955 [Thermodesulfobacteriota bacterium]|nr:hypothetical protein [Thermodesulfobacteriota bacterium]